MSTPNPEFNYKVAVFTITAKSNLHVGSGSQNYGIIDNMVQRDPLTGFPCIYSSSLKGALREYFRYYLKKDATWAQQESEKLLLHVFGFDKKDSIEDDETAVDSQASSAKIKQQPGKYRFLQADLLSIPVRSDQRLFYRTTCPYLLTNLKNLLSLYKSNLGSDYSSAINEVNSDLFLNAKAIHFDQSEAVLEETDLKAVPRAAIAHVSQLSKIVGDELAIATDVEFTELVSDFHLPVIARNNLNDGRSNNLWYEQVLPSETRFWFGVLYPDADDMLDNFISIIQSNPVQIGANASIGYGFCEIKLAEWFV